MRGGRSKEIGGSLRQNVRFRACRPAYSFLLTTLLLVLAAALPACRKESGAAGSRPTDQSYDTEPDWNDPQHLIALTYQQAQGKRVFYNDCVWCHADSTPAGPSNRTNLNPSPALANDGAAINPLTDEYLQNIIALGGVAVGKSSMMPPWGKTLGQDDIRAVIAFMRAIAQPPYRPPARTAAQYQVK